MKWLNVQKKWLTRKKKTTKRAHVTFADDQEEKNQAETFFQQNEVTLVLTHIYVQIGTWK